MSTDYPGLSAGDRIHRRPGNIVETTIRDIHAMCASMEPVRSAVDDYGKLLLGMETTYPMF